MDEDGVMVFNEQWDTRNKNHFPTLYQKADLIKKNLREPCLVCAYEMNIAFFCNSSKAHIDLNTPEFTFRK